MRLSINPTPGLLEIALDRIDTAASVLGYSVKNTENLVLCLWCLEAFCGDDEAVKCYVDDTSVQIISKSLHAADFGFNVTDRSLL